MKVFPQLLVTTYSSRIEMSWITSRVSLDHNRKLTSKKKKSLYLIHIFDMSGFYLLQFFWWDFRDHTSLIRWFLTFLFCFFTSLPGHLPFWCLHWFFPPVISFWVIVLPSVRLLYTFPATDLVDFYCKIPPCQGFLLFYTCTLKCTTLIPSAKTWVL